MTGAPLLALLVVVWAVSWPAIKIGVTAMPPIWYACLRYVIATACLFAFAAWRGELVIPPRSDRRLVGVSAALQMGAYSALTGLALTRLPPGRASVLAFSTPLWVVPLAAWRLGERASRRAVLGVGSGLVGVLVIASPSLHGDGGLLPYVLLVAAAAAWAVSIVAVRAHRFEASALALAPWQTLVAAALLAPLALVAEGGPPRVGPGGLASLAYVGPVATAFGYWAVVEAGRRLPASTMSVGLLATPALGVVISAVTLDEPVTASLVVGIGLVGAGIRLATTARSGEGEPKLESRRVSCATDTGTKCRGEFPEIGRWYRSG